MEFDPAAAADIAQRSTKIPIDLTSRYKKTASVGDHLTVNLLVRTKQLVVLFG